MSKCECEKCLHYEVCATYNQYGKFAIDVCNKHFKDKSLCVELPVRVGQVVYRIASYGNSRNQIICTEIEENQVVSVYYQEEIESQYKDKCKEFTFETTYAEGYTEEDIGDLVYLTKEEAEQKLKELENGK